MTLTLGLATSFTSFAFSCIHLLLLKGIGHRHSKSVLLPLRELTVIMLSSITHMLLLFLLNMKILLLLCNLAMEAEAPLLRSSMDASLVKILCIAMTKV